MKIRLTAFLVLVCVLVFSACTAPSYIEKQFYSAGTLEEGLVPDLPKPDGDFIYRTGTSAYCDKIYISSDEPIDEYFSRILDYIQENEFKIVGTIDSVKITTGNLFLTDDSYVFKSTKEISEQTLNDYYNDDSLEPYYSIIISNNDIEQGEYHEPYQHPENKDIHWDGYYDYYFRGTLIRLCVDEDKTLEYDDKSFDYAYYLEVRVNEQLWMDYSYEPQD